MGEVVLSPDYPIRTERLLVRPYRAADFDDYFAMHSREDVVRYLYWDVRSREQAMEMLQRQMMRTAIEVEGDAIVLAVELPDAGHVIGDVLLHWESQANQQGEIGFVFHPDYHGQGYATEAAHVMLDLGFSELNLHRIVGRCEAGNTASANLLTRLGMRQEAHLRENEFVKGRWDGELVYAMLDREWRALAP